MAKNENLPRIERQLWNELSQIANQVGNTKRSGKPAGVLEILVYKTHYKLDVLKKVTQDPHRKMVVGELRHLNLLLCQIASDQTLSYKNINYYFEVKNFMVSRLIATQ